MAIRCADCGREYDVTLFQFGRTVKCDCGNTVQMAAVQKAERPAVPLTRFILVRHGLTDWNREGRIQGQQPTHLNARGVQEAKLVARRLLREMPQNLYSSDLPRSMETAAETARLTGLGVTPTPKLREASFGRWEGRSFKDVQAESPGDFTNWVESDFHKAPPGGETAAELRERVIAFIGRTAEKHPNQASVLFTHGGPCKYAIAHVLGIAPTGVYRYAIDNASVHVIELGPYGWRLKLLNDTCHLAEAEQETTGTQ